MGRDDVTGIGLTRLKFIFLPRMSCLSNFPSRGTMSLLSPNLQTAVDAFRERVLNDNVATLSHLLSRLESQALEEASKTNRSDIETQAAVLRTLTMTYLRGDLPSSIGISRARDLLEVDNRPLLAEHFHLDGVLTGNIDVEEIQHWFASVRNELASLREQSDRSDLEGHWPVALPSELQSLMTNIRGIMRPGLHYYNHFGTDFFVSGFGCGSKASDSVFNPTGQDELTLVRPGWNVVAAVRLAKGDMNPSTMLVLYCRDDYDDSSKWAWRYGVCDEEWCSELFDDIGTFLNWYATYGVTTEEDITRELITVDWGWPRSFRGPRDAISVDALLRSGAVEQ